MTRRVLSVLDGLEPAVWMRTDVVGDGAWAPSSSTTCVAALAPRIPGHRRVPEPELDLLPTIDQLREGWELEWAAVDAWLPTVTDGFVGYVHLGVPVWQMLVHVVNHGSIEPKRRPLHPEGRSPGELDLINYAEEQAGDA